jgi:transposase
LILSRQEKEQLVIKLASEGKSTKNIAQIAHVSLGDIGKIIRRFTGEETGYQNKSPSITSKAFQMFKDGKSS